MIRIRTATPEDTDPIFLLARDFATSFRVVERTFRKSLKEILSADDAILLVAEDAEEAIVVGYCLGFEHSTFFANGKVGWVEEIMVRLSPRNRGIGRLLMTAFEDWAAGRGAKLVALATRRAARFYRAVGYEESATYYRKLLRP